MWQWVARGNIQQISYISQTEQHLPFKLMLLCLSLVPRPPLFLPSVCVHNNTRERKTSEKRGRPGSIHHVNDVRWTRGGRGGGRAQLPKQCTASSVRELLPQFWTPDLSVIETTRLDW